jgi:mitochondrial import receptor subunit TOM22
MVKVEIVEEKDAQLPGNSPYASSSSSRTSSSASLSSVSSQLSVDESIFDRIAALVDIVPPTTRHAISSRLATSASLIKRGGKLVGNIVWIITTSALLVGLPLALSLEDEAKIVAQEKEMLAQQQGAQQVRDHPPLLITFWERRYVGNRCFRRDHIPPLVRATINLKKVWCLRAFERSQPPFGLLSEPIPSKEDRMILLCGQFTCYHRRVQV